MRKLIKTVIKGNSGGKIKLLPPENFQKGIIMKIAITSTGNSAVSALDLRFGRAANFVFYDTDKDEFSSIDNKQNLNAAQGAGIQSAELICKEGAKVLITGHCGPKAFRVLKAAGVEVYNCKAETVKKALKLYQEGKLQKAEDADVDAHW